MRTPVLGLSGKWKRNPRETFPAYGEWKYSLTSSYVDLAVSCGACSVVLLPTDDAERLLELVDVLLLTGGGDPDPELYGGERGSPTDFERQRPMWDLRLYRTARSMGLPVLGVCLGMQLIGIAEGSGMIEDIASEVEGALDHHGVPESLRFHEVELAEGSTLHSLIGPVREVSSFHHQAIDSVPPGFSKIAETSDGLIEAIESDDRLVMGVQWHPELDDTGGAILGHMLKLATRVGSR